jgi:two-component system NarL family response regulator
MRHGRVAKNVALQRRIRVLVADDHEVVREGLVALINRQRDMEVVTQVCDGQTAVDRFTALRPDVGLLDVRMLRLDGIAATKMIRGRIPEARVILLSAYECEEQVYQGVRAGAMSYLVKDTPCDELLDTIREVHRGVTCIPHHIAAKLAARVTRTELSARELEVLRLMVVGKSNKEIGAILYITEGTVKVHGSSLMKKLGATARTEAVNLALMHGIVSLE